MALKPCVPPFSFARRQRHVPASNMEVGTNWNRWRQAARPLTQARLCVEGTVIEVGPEGGQQHCPLLERASPCQRLPLELGVSEWASDPYLVVSGQVGQGLVWGV